MSRALLKRFGLSLAVAGGVAAGPSAAPAAPYTWNKTTDANWNDPTSWLEGVVPPSDPATQLTFGGSAAYTATNDIGPFTLNSLAVSNTAATTIAGNTLSFAGSAPALTVAAGSGATTVSAGITYTVNTAVTNGSTNTLTLSGATTYAAGTTTTFAGTTIAASGAQTFGAGSAVVYTGTGTLGIGTSGGPVAFGSTTTFTNGVSGGTNTGTLRLTSGATFSGTAVALNLANYNPTAGTFTVGNMPGVTGSINILAGRVTAAITTGDLFGPSATLNVSGGATFDFNANTEDMGAIAGAGTIVTTSAVTLTMQQTGSYVWGGVIQGAGAFATSTGVNYTFTGNNTYTGNTTITSGTTVTLGNGGTAGAVNGNVVATGGLVFNRSDAVTFSKVVSGSGTLTHAGTGTVTLTGTNTYTGATTVNNGGTLRLDFSAAGAPATNILYNGQTAAGLSLLAGSTLAVQGPTAATTSQTFGALGIVGTATTGGGGLDFVNIAAPAGNTTTLTFASVTRGLSAAVQFNFPAAGTGSGVVNVTATQATGGPGGILLDSGTAGNGIPFATVGTTDYAARATTTGPVVGGSTIAGFYTPSTTTLTAASNADVVTDPTLTAGVSLTSVRFNDPAARTVALGGFTLNTSGILVSSASGGATVSGGTLTGRGATNVELLIFQYSPNALTIDAVVANNGTSRYSQVGTGTVVITRAATFTGNTYIGANTTLQLSPSATTGADGNVAGTSGIRNFGTLVLAPAGAISLGATSAPISGTGAVVKRGVGSVTLRSANVYTGPTTVADGALIASATTSFSAASDVTLDSTGGTAPVLRLAGFDNAVQSLASVGTGGVVENGSTTTAVTLTISGTGTTTFAGTIQDGTGAAALAVTKGGIGTQTLSGANTYTGATTVSAGTLLVSGQSGTTSGTGTGVVTVATGARLAGDGQVGTGTAGSVTVSTGGTLAPGLVGAVGTLKVNTPTATAVTLSAGSTLAVNIAGGGTGSRLQVLGGGGVDLTGLTAASPLAIPLTAVTALNPGQAYSFTVISDTAGSIAYPAGGFASNLFNVTASGFTPDASGFTVSGTPSAVTVSFTTAAVPEPATALLLAGAGLAFGRAVRWRIGRA